MTAQATATLTALVADDEELARRRIIERLKHRPSVRVIGECATGPATLEAVRARSPDLLYLDVQMPGLNGFEVLERLEPEERPVVIFSTAYDEYALTAFEVNAVDYLLKPFSDERFYESLERAQQRLRSATADEFQRRVRALLDHVAAPTPGDPHRGYRQRFAIRSGERLTVIDVQTVDWIEGAGDYARLQAGNESHLIRSTLTALERELDPGQFLRIHRSTIVRLDCVRHLRPGAHGDYLAVLEGGERLRVGRRYRKEALRRLGL